MTATLASAKKTVTARGTAIDELFGSMESTRLLIGIELSEVFDVYQAVPALVDTFGKFAEWAQSHLPGESSSTIYRLKDAGKVARILPDTRGAKERTLAKFHPALANGTPEEVEASEQLVRDLFEQACKGLRNGKSPTEAKVDEVLKSAKVTGSRGPAKKKSGKKSGNPAKPATVEIDPAALEASITTCRANLSRQFKAWEKRGIPEDAARLVLLAGIRYANEHGIDVLTAALGTSK